MTDSHIRFLLRPLHARRRRRLTRRQIEAAAATLDAVLAGDSELQARRAAFFSALSDEGRGSFVRDPEAAHQWIEFNRLLYQSRRISWTRYVFMASIGVEGVYDDQWFRQTLDPPLDSLNAEMEALEEAGAESSERYQNLSSQREAAYEAGLTSAFRELGAGDIADVRDADPALYDELRERGRRGANHSGSYNEALRDVVDEIYGEAISSAHARNFRAAVTLLGAALEGLLLMRCLRSPLRAKRIAAALPRRLRGRAGDDPRTWTFEVLIEVTDRAGWLARLQGRRGEYSPSGLAHSIRSMRNWIHPAREAANRPWEGVFEQDYEVALALYTLVKTSINRPRSLRRGV